MGSWECDIGASNAKRAIARKTEKKKHFLFLFPQPFLILDSKRWDFSHSICSQIQTVPIRTRCLCLLCRGKGHAHIIKSTGSRRGKRLLSKGISQKPFLTDDLAGVRYKKTLPSLKDNSLSCIRYVWQYCFPKNRIVLPRARRLFPGKVIPQIGPIAVSCHSSSVWFLVSLLLPLLFLLRSSSDRLQVLDLCSSTKLRIAKDTCSLNSFRELACRIEGGMRTGFWWTLYRRSNGVWRGSVGPFEGNQGNTWLSGDNVENTSSYENHWESWS